MMRKFEYQKLNTFLYSCIILWIYKAFRLINEDYKVSGACHVILFYLEILQMLHFPMHAKYLVL